jgi:hypothetical protein
MGIITYLGVPSMVGRARNQILHISKIRYGGKSIHGGRPLSKAGKDVIPSYVTSIYIILNAMVNDIEKMLNSFWWGGRY